jgi:nitrogen regulatory protein PII
MFNLSAIIVIVERGKAEQLINKAKGAGAQGATVVYGRGTGETEAKKFFNIQIESSKEIIIILTENAKLKNIFNTLVEAGRLKEPGTGVIFTVPVSNLVGLHSIKDYFSE